jgi:hypothetical protein
LRLAHTVERVGGWSTREIEQRGQPVGIDHRRPDHDVAGEAWTADDERDAKAAFIKVALAGAKRRVVRHPRVWTLRHVQSAVVAGEDDDRPLAETTGIEVREQPADAVIQRLNGRGI